MKTKTKPRPTVKHYRPTFAAFTAQAIADSEAREDAKISCALARQMADKIRDRLKPDNRKGVRKMPTNAETGGQEVKTEDANNYKIEQGVPLPPPRGGTGLSAVLRVMKVGDSFVLEKEKRASLHSCARSLNMKMSFRLISETEGRAWRIK